MNPQLIKYARETDISIAMSRRENRSKLFTIYPQLSTVLSTKSPNGLSEQIEPYKEMFGTRVFVKCENIAFKLQAPGEGDRDACQIEPYHTTLCLFDAKIGRKLTENFHFDVNHPVVYSMVQNNNTPDGKGDASSTLKTDLPANLPNEWLLYPKQALLSITNPHPDIFLVVRIEKVLQGGICQTTEPYIKVNKDPKAAFKVYKSVLASCQRLGHYRMPFAWTARPLFR